MAKSQKSYQFASLLLALSGAIHIAGSMVSGFQTPAPQLLALGTLFLIVAYFMRSGRRWLAYFAFLFTIFGAAIAYTYWGGRPEFPDWAWLGIMATNAACALILFVNIWRNKPIATE